mgnify:CR=1 FL=1
MKKLSTYILKHSHLYILSIVCLIIQVGLDMLSPQITKSLIDDVLGNGDWTLFPWLLTGIAGIGVGRCIFGYIKEYNFVRAGSKSANCIRRDLFHHVQSLSVGFFDKTNTGELMSRVKDDVDRIWDIAAYMGILLAEVVIRTVTTIYFLFRINWQLALIPCAGMIAAAFIALKMEKKLDVLFGDLAQKNSELNNTAAENLAGVRTVKAFAREGFEINKFHKHNQKYYELNIDLSRVFVKYNPMMQIITRMLSVISLLLGGLILIKGNPFMGGQKLTMGELIAFTQYVGGMIWPIEMLGWLTNGVASAKASIKRLNKIYSEMPDILDESKIEEDLLSPFDVAGSVKFNNVTYKAGERNILENVSFEIKAGQTLGIMGATGSGKTTIINLLKRMYDVSDGSIELDGVDIRQFPLATLRKSVACVMQDIFLFSDTIDGNIRLGERETMTTPTVRLALEKSHSAEFVDKMKDKEHTVIGERGVGLSGGQKQRITIARALARKTPILVLDDSTSALDTETEQEIQGVLAELSGMTKIIIAHRISAVRKADKIIVLDGGKVCEEGTHEELLAKGGLYKETYDSQY